MATINYFSNKEQKLKQVELPSEISGRVKQATKDYETSFSIIRKYYFHLWNQAIKDYELSNYDRKTILKNWQSNIAYGLVRQSIDVFVSSILEKPFKFSAFGITEEGTKNRENVEHILNTVSDRTKLHVTVPNILTEGLILGAYCLKTIFAKGGKKVKIIETIDGKSVESEITTQYQNNPITTGVDIFKIFPDMYPGKMRYITERDVSSLTSCHETFKDMIDGDDNDLKKLNWFNKDYIKSLGLPKNQEHGSMEDFGKIRMQIYEKENEQAQLLDKFGTELDNGSTYIKASPLNYDQDLELTEGLIEWKLTTYNNKVVLTWNGFPVYVGTNIYGKINYFIGTAFATRARFSMGIAYILRGFESVGRSYLNNFIDGVRNTSQPSFIASKSLTISERNVRNLEPGQILYADATDTSKVMTRIDKGQVSDNGIMNIVDAKGGTIVGVSDYNLGISAGERTSPGALSGVESSMRRMTQYIKRFSNVLGDVGEFWLELIAKYWTEKEYLATSDIDGNEIVKVLGAKDAGGTFNISLQTEGMLAANKSIELKRMLEAYNLTAGSGKVNVDEVIAEIYRLMGYNANKFVPTIGAEANIPEDRKNKTFGEVGDSILKSQQLIGGDLNTESTQEDGQAMSDQTDMGNNGAGQNA